MMGNTKDNKRFAGDVALLVMSCDAYIDVARYYFDLFDKNISWWESKKYIVLETLELEKHDVQTIKTGKIIDWNSRLKYALSIIKEKYILYVQEDYFIGKSVSEDEFKCALDYIENNNIVYYKLDNFPKVKHFISKGSFLSKIPKNKRYGINLLTAIVNKGVFIKMLPDTPADAWVVETSFLKKVPNSFEGYIDDAIQDTRNIFCTKYAVRQGKWWPDTIRYFKKKGYIIDTSVRGLLSWKKVVRTKIGHFCSHHLPTSLFRFAKKVLIKLGVKFASDG